MRPIRSGVRVHQYRVFPRGALLLGIHPIWSHSERGTCISSGIPSQRPMGHSVGSHGATTPVGYTVVPIELAESPVGYLMGPHS